MRKIIAWLLLEPGETMIRVKSLRPTIGKYGVEWLTVTIDSRGGSRRVGTFVWDRAMFQHIWRRIAHPTGATRR